MSDDEYSDEEVPETNDEYDNFTLEGDICGDGSIVKTITKAGSGDDRPRKGTECQVHYVGTLTNGEKFDSSRDRSDPFKFKIGSGVITGWSEGVSTMKLGEVANFSIQPHKAYGERGQGSIPANSVLNFEIELLSFSNNEDVSPKKDQSITKDVKKVGTGFEKPTTLAKASITYTITLDSGDVIINASTEPVTVTVDDNDIIPGFDVLIKSMKKGEKADFTIKAAHAYGAAGNSALGVPANSNIKGTVSLVDFANPLSSWKLNDEQKVAELDAMKNEGNELFKSGHYAKALKRYSRGVDVVSDLTGDLATAASASKLGCLLNSSMCHLKTKSYKLAIEQTNKALEVDAQNIKALFRRATANTELGEWDTAIQDLHALLQIDSSNKEAFDALNKVKTIKAQYVDKERKLYASMFK